MESDGPDLAGYSAFDEQRRDCGARRRVLVRGARPEPWPAPPRLPPREVRGTRRSDAAGATAEIRRASAALAAGRCHSRAAHGHARIAPPGRTRRNSSGAPRHPGASPGARRPACGALSPRADTPRGRRRHPVRPGAAPSGRRQRRRAPGRAARRPCRAGSAITVSPSQFGRRTRTTPASGIVRTGITAADITVSGARRPRASSSRRAPRRAPRCRRPCRAALTAPSTARSPRGISRSRIQSFSVVRTASAPVSRTRAATPARSPRRVPVMIRELRQPRYLRPEALGRRDESSGCRESRQQKHLAPAEARRALRDEGGRRAGATSAGRRRSASSLPILAVAACARCSLMAVAVGGFVTTTRSARLRADSGSRREPLGKSRPLPHGPLPATTTISRSLRQRPVLEPVVEDEGVGPAGADGDSAGLVAALPHDDRHAGQPFRQEHGLVAAVARAEPEAATVGHDSNAARAPSISPADDGGSRAHLAERQHHDLGQRGLAASAHRHVADRDDRHRQAARRQKADPVRRRSAPRGRPDRPPPPR